MVLELRWCAPSASSVSTAEFCRSWLDTHPLHKNDIKHCKHSWPRKPEVSVRAYQSRSGSVHHPVTGLSQRGGTTQDAFTHQLVTLSQLDNEATILSDSERSQRQDHKPEDDLQRTPCGGLSSRNGGNFVTWNRFRNINSGIGTTLLGNSQQ